MPLRGSELRCYTRRHHRLRTLWAIKKGSFTDAVTERKGYFEVANGGTIFSSTKWENSLAHPSSPATCIESGEFMKVGSSEVQRTDIRSSYQRKNLQQAIQEKKFRE